MCSPLRVAVAQYTLIAVTHHRDTAAPAILLHHILAWEDRKAFLCLILAKFAFNWLKSVFSSYFMRSPLWNMKVSQLTTYILIAESPMHYSSSTATLHITLYNSFRPINISHHFPATVLFRCRCYGTGGDWETRSTCFSLTQSGIVNG